MLYLSLLFKISIRYVLKNNVEVNSMQLSLRGLSVMLIIISLFVLPACFNRTPETLQEGLIVVNVLDKPTYDDCHIRGSINVPFEQFEEYAQKHWNHEKADIVVYCSNYMCSSSEYAYHQLKRMGFKSIAVYQGGTAEWYQKGLPVDGPCASSYLKQEIAPHTDSTVVIITADELAKKLQKREDEKN